MRSRISTPARLLGGALAAFHLLPACAAQVEGYAFPAAAQEITQLYWLAETATACGWASHDDSARFKLFSLRFLSAHLSDAHQRALLTLVTRAGYEDGVRNAARESATLNCASNRWHAGWMSYKAAADANEGRY